MQNTPVKLNTQGASCAYVCCQKSVMNLTGILLSVDIPKITTVAMKTERSPITLDFIFQLPISF